MKFEKNILFLIIIIIGLNACQQNGNKEDNLLTTADDTLSYELAKRYVKNYEKNAGYVETISKDSTGTIISKAPDTRSVWFDIERLESIVKQIKAEGGDGIRFYLGTYDQNYPEQFKMGHIPPTDYWGYNTLIMVSTKDSLKKYHRDYYSETTKAGKKRKGVIMSVGSAPENRGEICPPPSDCYDIGATLIEEN
ncbi:hypothetical protein [Pedobacter alpinus]|uniref:Uncharacterized protein n=1 Tax=Pedobacter alpinus TaxID=1590643 RepID=A0ABW5TUU3_9SPHI